MLYLIRTTKGKMHEIVLKGWETRRKKTSFEASSVSRPAEAGDAGT